VIGQTVCPGHFTATDKALVFIELEAGWVLEQVWTSGEEIVLLLLQRFEPQIFQCIYWLRTDCAATYWFEYNTDFVLIY